MNIVGLIAEYNPFHNGHLYHINKAKEVTNADFVVVVMSGNYVQRGEPAFCDKYLRTQMALLNGASLVLELPVMYATSSAEYFAKASVTLLEKTGIVNSLCFGSECGDVDKLSSIANILLDEPDTYKKTLKINLDKGVSFPTARALAVSSVTGIENDILKNPNNILGVEYLKALKLLNSKIKPYAIKREISSYNSIDIQNEISSATAIRHSAKSNDYTSISKTMPLNAYSLLQNSIKENKSPILYDNFSHILHYIIKSSTREQLSDILDITEGLENRIIHFSNYTFLISELIDLVKTKRYTHTKIQRAIIHMLLGINKNDFDIFNQNSGPQYLRVLGFNKNSQHLLNMMERNSSLPMIMNLKNAKNNLSPLAMSMLDKEIQSTDLYYLGLSNLNKFLMSKKTEYKIPLQITRDI